MIKKIVDGKVIWVKEAGDDVQEPGADPAADAAGDTPSTDPAPDGDGDGDDNEAIEKAATRIAKSVAKTVTAEIYGGATPGQRAKRFIDQPGNAKLAEILNGKDLYEDREKLTKEEVIVSFFHALQTNNTEVVKALSEGVAADGGNLLPQAFHEELVRDLQQTSFMRGICRVVPMRRNTLVIPNLAAGPKAYWTAEGAAKTTSTAAFTQLTLTAYKLAAILYSTDELIEDSEVFDIVQLIISLFSESIAREEEAAFMQGNGTSQPKGIFTSVDDSSIAGVAAGGNLSFDSFIDLTNLLPSKYHRNARFLLHRNNLKEVQKLKDTNGQYLWQSPASGRPGTILGFPYELSDDAPEDAIVFGDFKLGYWIGDKGQISVLISQHTTTAFTQDKTAIRVVERVGGLTVLPAAFRALTAIP